MNTQNTQLDVWLSIEKVTTLKWNNSNSKTSLIFPDFSRYLSLFADFPWLKIKFPDFPWNPELVATLSSVEYIFMWAYSHEIVLFLVIMCLYVTAKRKSQCSLVFYHSTSSKFNENRWRDQFLLLSVKAILFNNRVLSKMLEGVRPTSNNFSGGKLPDSHLLMARRSKQLMWNVKLNLCWTNGCGLIRARVKLLLARFLHPGLLRASTGPWAINSMDPCVGVAAQGQDSL